MNQFIESLARLYILDKITSDKLKALYDAGKINEQEYQYILDAKKVV